MAIVKRRTALVAATVLVALLFGGGTLTVLHSNAGTEEAEMKIWFEGKTEVACDMARVEASLRDVGAHHLGVVSRMPGLSTIELVEQKGDAVTIRTNEGLMERTSLSKRVEGDRVVVEYDERYEAGSMVTANAHFRETFTPVNTGVEYTLVISGMKAPGLVGFVYRNFGGGNIGRALMASAKAHLEQTPLP